MHYPYLRILLALAVIVGVVAIIVKIIKKLSNAAAAATPAPAPVRETAESDDTYSSPRTSTIFVNGGAPASGNIMGTVTVDGKSVTVRYTDAPVEITIPAGEHHVVVEGGVHGDARIDRRIDFGVLDVWTVDLPGGGDADVIRHQMIDYSTYKQALRDSDFHVTKRSL